jgi:elongator complex protein 1
VNVGWGDKSTQFRGSVGKSASSSTASPAEPTPHLLTDDDRAPRISWRGDAAFFAVSSLDPIRGVEGAARRSIRIFSRLAALSSTSESTGGLEQVVSWQPSGSIIASTQKLFKADGTVDSHHVVFFERNGLRRYDFALREPEASMYPSVWNLAVHFPLSSPNLSRNLSSMLVFQTLMHSHYDFKVALFLFFIPCSIFFLTSSSPPPPIPPAS